MVDRAQGCLLMGAQGDALGAPIEFMKWEAIQDRYGEAGIEVYDKVRSLGLGSYKTKEVGAVTDDTQMALYLAEGLTAAELVTEDTIRSIAASAYMSWMRTQMYRPTTDIVPFEASSDLRSAAQRQGPRAPGRATMVALSQRTRDNLETSSQNDSKGNGTVMRVAPIGIYMGVKLGAQARSHELDVFRIARREAGLTHSHTLAHDASGIQAMLIARMVAGESFSPALVQSVAQSARSAGADETVTDMVVEAVDQAQLEEGNRSGLTIFGSGRVAEEALAMAVYVAADKYIWAHDDFAHSLRLAVNHRGDSDTVGAIAGNLLGAEYGAEGAAIAAKELHATRSRILGADVEPEVVTLEPLIKRIATQLAESAIRSR